MELKKLLADGLTSPIPISQNIYGENHYMTLTAGHYNLDGIHMALVVNILFVQPMAQNRGVVSLLVDLLAKEATNAGYERLILDLEKFKLTFVDENDVKAHLFDRGFAQYAASNGVVFWTKTLGRKYSIEKLR